MENNNNEYNHNYDSGDFKSDAVTIESVDNAMLTDDNSEVGNTEEGSNAVFDNENGLVYDAAPYTAALEHEEGAKKPILQNTELPGCSMDRLNSKPEALHTIESNRRALPENATTYELEFFDKHALVIFNHKIFDNKSTRFGTDKDVDSLTTTFTNLGFEVKTHNDLTKDALIKELEEFSKQDFTDYGCVAVAILTHGSRNGMLWAADQRYSEIEVLNHFMNCKRKRTLVTKPKIFIIQACRGSEISTGVPVQSSRKLRRDGESDLESFYILPLEADLLLIHSSYPGRSSHRDTKYGSWFIQTLCEEIDTLSSKLDLESIITEVKRKVAINMGYEHDNKKTGETKVYKQIPVLTSTLVRKLYLKKSEERALEETYVGKPRWRIESRHEVLDAVSCSPMTPLPVQFGSCSCILEHFTYMRDCLRYFVAENPNDETAKGILKVASTYADSDDFNKSKDEMCKVISKHLMDNAQNSQFYRYLHFVPVERKVINSKNAQNELSMSLKSSFSSLDVCLTGIFVATFVFVLRNVKSN